MSTEYTVKLRLLTPQAVVKMPGAAGVRRLVAYELESRGLNVTDFNLAVFGPSASEIREESWSAPNRLTTANEDEANLASKGHAEALAAKAHQEERHPEPKSAKYVLTVLGGDGSPVARYKVMDTSEVSADDAFLFFETANGGRGRHLLSTIGGWRLDPEPEAKVEK